MQAISNLQRMLPKESFQLQEHTCRGDGSEGRGRSNEERKKRKDSGHHGSIGLIEMLALRRKWSFEGAGHSLGPRSWPLQNRDLPNQRLFKMPRIFSEMPAAAFQIPLQIEWDGAWMGMGHPV